MSRICPLFVFIFAFYLIKLVENSVALQNRSSIITFRTRLTILVFCCCCFFYLHTYYDRTPYDHSCRLPIFCQVYTSRSRDCAVYFFGLFTLPTVQRRRRRSKSSAGSRLLVVYLARNSHQQQRATCNINRSKKKEEEKGQRNVSPSSHHFLLFLSFPSGSLLSFKPIFCFCT